MFIPSLIAIKKSNRDKFGLFAIKTIPKDSIIFHFEGKMRNLHNTNPKSLQIDDDKFLKSTLKFDDFLNHSCEPNSFVDWKSLSLKSLRDISGGEEITYNYNTSEYDLINQIRDCSFKCNCKSTNCIGLVKGFKYLSINQKIKVFQFLSPFLRRKLEEELLSDNSINSNYLLFESNFNSE